MAVTQRIKNKNGEWVLVSNKGGGSTPNITVDSELSSESTNPIQNKAVADSLKNRPELLEIRYYFGEKELTEEDKAINVAAINTYITNGQKNLYKFFIQNEFRWTLESNSYMVEADENGDPSLYIIFDNLYAISIMSDAKKYLPFMLSIDINGNITSVNEMDGPVNSVLVIGEDESNALEIIPKIRTADNPGVSPFRPISIHRKISNNGNTFMYGLTIAPITTSLIMPPYNEPVTLVCIMEDGFVHQIKLDGTTGFIIEDKIKESSSNEEEPKILGASVESDRYIINKYSALGYPPLLVADGLGGGTTIGAYAQHENGTYYYTFIDQLGNVYRKEVTEDDKTTIMLLNRDAIYLFDNMQEGDDYAILNIRSLSGMKSLPNLIMPEPVICYKIVALQGSAVPLQAISIYPLRVEALNRTEDGVSNSYYKYTILGDNLDTIEVWEVNINTGVSVLVSTTPFADILGLNTNA